MKPSLSQLLLSLALLGVALVLIICMPGKPAPTPRSFAATPSPKNGGDTEHRSTFGGGQGEGGTATQTRHPSRTPTITRTRKPATTPAAASTRPPTATITPTTVFSIPGQLAAVMPADNLGYREYGLRPWSEAFCTALVERVASRKFSAETAVTWVAPYALALQAECLLRYPGSADREQMLWDLARIDPLGLPVPGMRVGGSLFTYLLEDLYTRGVIRSDEELTQTLESEDILFRVADSIHVQGLFGDGQEALVFTLVRARVDWGRACATLAIRRTGSLVRVETLQEWEQCDWGMATNYLSLPGAADTNGNGLPEVIVVSKWGASGFPQQWSESIYLYEWDASKEAFMSTNIPIFDQDCDRGPCEGQYEIGPVDQDNFRTITVTETWYTDGSPEYASARGGIPLCPPLLVRRAYRWNGTRYAAGDPELVPPQPERPECRAAWAGQAISRYGWQNDQAIAILSEALDSWPETMNKIWGPASRDYFRLRLGLWRDLRGEGQAALALLQGLSDSPTDPHYDLPARLAAEYLQARSQAGLAGACLKVQQSWNAEVEAVKETLNTHSQLKAQWGFTEPHWGLNGIRNIDDLCTPEQAITAGSPTHWAASTTNLKNWLEIIGVQVLAVKPADLDGNGGTDWLALINTEEGGRSADLWAFMRAPDGLKASRVDDIGAVSETDFTLRSYRPVRGAPLVHVVQAGGDLSIFYVDASNTAVWLGGESAVVGQWVDERPEGSQLMVYTQPPYQPSEVKTYTWNAVTQSMDERTLGFDYAAAEAEAERLLFQAQDYTAAIETIRQYLREGPEWYEPYMRYLLALAYEMNGQADKAVESYFWLWRDYPTHLFGMAAQLKLELIAP